MNVAMIEYTTATKLAAVYKDSVAKIKSLILQLGEESKKLQDAFDTTYAFDVDVYFKGDRHDPDLSAVDKLEDNMRREAWGELINKLGIRKLMSSQRQRELDDAIHRGNRRYGTDSPVELPEIDEETIFSVLLGMIQSADEFLEEAIREEFDFWKTSRFSGDYKRNSPYKLSKKIIRRYVVEREYYGGFRPSYSQESHVMALDRIFHALDGRGVPEGHYGPLASAIRTCGPSGVGQTEYFAFRCCKNGNLHLEFKRDDLLERFNLICGRNRLPHEEVA